MTEREAHIEKVFAAARETAARAKHPDNPYKPKPDRRKRSSLHQIIRTKEQADRLMAELERLSKM